MASTPKLTSVIPATPVKAPVSEGEGDAVVPHLTRRGVKRREQLLDAAAELFLTHGYDGTCIDELVRHAGGSKSNIYRQFGGKAGLFASVVQELLIGCVEPFTSCDYSLLPMREGLAKMGMDLVQELVSAKHIALQRLVYAEARRFPEIGHLWYREGPGRSRRHIAAYFSFRAEQGELALSEVPVLAELFHDMLVYTPINLAMSGQPMDATQCRQHADTVAQYFFLTVSNSSSPQPSER